ncbi:MAG: phosphatidylglycerophosphatase A, partial [Methylococcales bacterium]
MSIFLNSEYGRNRLTPKQILFDPVLFLAFGFGSGLVKKAPGTMGTVAAIPVYWLFAQANNLFYGLLTIFVILVGIWICGNAADKLGEHDFGGIVWDEMVAFWLVLIFITPTNFWIQAIAFILFRFFDAVKPGPIGMIDRYFKNTSNPDIPSSLPKIIWQGFGIMIDDLAA